MTQRNNKTKPMTLAREWLNDERPKGDISADKVMAAIQLMQLDTLGDICEALCDIACSLERMNDRQQRANDTVAERPAEPDAEPGGIADVPPVGGETVVLSPPPEDWTTIDC